MELNVTSQGLEVKAQNKTELYAVESYLEKNEALKSHIVFVGDVIPKKEAAKVVPKKEEEKPKTEEVVPEVVTEEPTPVPAPKTTEPTVEVRTQSRDKERVEIVGKLNKAGIAYDRKMSTASLIKLYEEKTSPNLKVAPKVDEPKAEPKAEEKKEGGVSQTEVFSKLKNFAVKYGGDMAKTHILSKLGVVKFSELPQEKWGELSKLIDDVNASMDGDL